MPDDDRVRFWQGGWSRIKHEDGFYRDGDPGWLPARELVGKMVNLGTKDGLVYEKVIVGGVTPDGVLALRPGFGFVGWPYQPEREPKDVEPGECVPVTEIARGYVHEEQ